MIVDRFRSEAKADAYRVRDHRVHGPDRDGHYEVRFAGDARGCLLEIAAVEEFVRRPATAKSLENETAAA